MSDYQLGDLVDITIRGSTVTSFGPGWVTVAHADTGGMETIGLDSPAVTVTRRSPQPHAGDVWRLANGEVWHLCSSKYDGLWAHAATNGHANSVKDLDLAGATRLFTLDPEATT